jgi:Flp pilus assembly CpaE family ATPase
VRLLLNRAQEPYPIPPAQIESTLGHPIHHTFPSDYKAVSTALNSGVPLTLSGASDIASQFESFIRGVLEIDAAAAPNADKRPRTGLEKLASLW